MTQAIGATSMPARASMWTRTAGYIFMQRTGSSPSMATSGWSSLALGTAYLGTGGGYMPGRAVGQCRERHAGVDLGLQRRRRAEVDLRPRSGTVRNPVLGKCLDVEPGNAASGTPVWIWDCNGGDAQKWTYDPGSGTVRNPALGKCLDVQWGNFVGGTPVWIWDCNGGDAQKWTYDP